MDNNNNVAASRTVYSRRWSGTVDGLPVEAFVLEQTLADGSVQYVGTVESAWRTYSGMHVWREIMRSKPCSSITFAKSIAINCMFDFRRDMAKAWHSTYWLRDGDNGSIILETFNNLAANG